MRLAISNIAWERSEEETVARVMSDAGLDAVEIAPTKAWDKPLDATAGEIEAYRRWWSDRDVQIVAMQSLNFGHPEFQIFADSELRRQMLDYLKGIVVLGARLGVSVLVFGSPKNRLAADRDPAEVTAIARDFFGELGRTASAEGVCFCIEPNPTDYGCDWVTAAAAGVSIVTEVDTPGFGLHLDAAGMTLAGDDPTVAIPAAIPLLRHFHCSAPNLAEVSDETVDHEAMSVALRSGGYPGLVSVEMRAGEPGTNVGRVGRALALARRRYA